MFKYILLVLLMVIVAGAAMVRVRPVDIGKFHTEDMATLIGAGEDGKFSAGAGGDIPALELTASIEEVGAALRAIIDATPRTRRAAGALEGGPFDKRVSSFVTRSKVFGFPDVTTVALEQTEGNGTRVSMHGRLVYGKYDMDVNAARIKSWLDQLSDALK